MRVYSEFEIKMPRWKQRVVGLAAYKVSDHNKVKIMAARKNGERYYPDTYYISGEEVRKCEKQMLPQGLELYLVPINKLEVLEPAQKSDGELMAELKYDRQVEMFNDMKEEYGTGR